jgi:cysteinyl-tRNA synthetase
MNFKIYNTLSKQLEVFTPNHPDRVSVYTCGPTVYDDAHIGNFRSFLAADLLRRWIESPLCRIKNEPKTPENKPRKVIQVMNITDVGHMTEDDNADGAGEDKMEVAARRILEAKKSGKLPTDSGVNEDNPFEIARYYEQRFIEDAVELGLKVAIDETNRIKDNNASTPTFMPRATDNIEGMIQVIEQLLKDSYAYPAGEPGARAIYFDVQRFERYGQLSGNSIDQLKGGAGGRTDESNTQQKRHPADFLLWKEDASHKMKWASPAVPDQQQWGDGYPGWHIECTAMALNRLVEGGLDAAKSKQEKIDLHSGGEDNIFPHHECEIAQSCCFTGADSFANFWFHPRFLKVEGEKMSKSKGTMFTLRDLKDKGFDPAAVRLELIKTHYRANADFSVQGLKDSTRIVERWRKFVDAGTQGDTGTINETVQAAVSEAMNEDLNIAGAIGEINKWIKDTPNPTKSDAQLFMIFDDFLSVLALKKLEQTESQSGIALYQPGVTPSPEIEQLLTQRRDAKKSKDFAAADAIRDQLTQMGLAIMDKPGGKVEVAPIN